MSPWLFTDHGISEDPHDGMQDLLAQADTDADTLFEVLTDFFGECPDAWRQFCAHWVKWHEAELEDEDIL